MPADLSLYSRICKQLLELKQKTYVPTQAFVLCSIRLVLAIGLILISSAGLAQDLRDLDGPNSVKYQTKFESRQPAVKTSNQTPQQHTVHYVPFSPLAARNSHLGTANTSNSLSDDDIVQLQPNNPFEKYQGMLSSTESAMIRDAKDNQFNYFTLLDAALIAGGVIDPIQLESYRQQYRKRVIILAQQIPSNASPLQVARIILEYLHSEMFKEYLLESSNIGAIFDSGIYNCVTGVTLFNNLARQFGLNAVALELPGHAMSRIYLPDGTYYDVETTCAIWFQLQNYPGRQEQVIERMLVAGSKNQVAGTTVVRREINDVELVAKLYYNRGVEMLNKSDYLGSLNCNAKALVLDPNSETAKGNFLATINNWAITESKVAHFETAVAILRLGIQIEPTYSIFKNNHVHIYHQWIEQKCKAERFEEALELSRQAIAEAPDEEHFRKLEAYSLMGVQRATAKRNSNPTSQPVTTSVGYAHQ